METSSEMTGARRRVLEALVDSGGATASDLADGLGISAVAVRQHLSALQASGHAEPGSRIGDVGRPSRLWRPGPQAQGSLADGHEALSVEILRAAEEIGLLDRLLGRRTEDQLERYSARMDPGATLANRIATLAAIRSEEGYRASSWTEDDGSVWLAENHCPLHCAVQSCLGLCTAEQNLFGELVGPSVEIQRTEHIASGDRRCVYRFRAR